MSSVKPDYRETEQAAAAEISICGADNLPEFLEIALVLSPYAHALVESIDIEEALNLEGVHAVLSGRDIPGENTLCAQAGKFPLLAVDSVAYHSQPVAVVIAENASVANHAVDLVRVEYKPRIPVLGMDEAIALQSFHDEELVLHREGANKAGDDRSGELTKEFTIAGHDDCSLEGCEVLAEPGKDGQVSINASIEIENRGFARSVLAGLLGKDRSKIRIVSGSGALAGDQSAGNLMVPAIAALAAMATGKPVRAGLSRQTGFKLRARQNPVRVIINASYNSSALISSLDCMVYLDGGWEAERSQSVLHDMLHHLDSAYFFPEIRVAGRVCKTNCLSSSGSPLKGKALAALVAEEIIAGVALRLKMKPELVRESNLYAPGGDRSVTHYGQDVDGMLLRDAWKRVKELSAHEERATEIAEWNSNASSARRGLAVVPIKVGCGVSVQEARPVKAEVSLMDDGSATVSFDGFDGEGMLCASVATVIEEELGVTRDNVSMMEGGAAQCIPTGHNELYVEAVIDACHQLRDNLRMVAATRLEARGIEISDIMELTFSGGGVSDPEHPDEPISLSSVITKAMADGMQVKRTGIFNAVEVYGNRHFRDFSCGVASAEVLVDGFTGEVRVLRVDIVQDVGRQTGELAESLIGSSFMRGLGWLTCGKINWMPNGQIITEGICGDDGSSAVDVPLHFHCEALADDSGHQKAPGDTAFCLAISIREAIRDAIVAFGGVKPRFQLPHPVSPEAVYFSIAASDS
ncbi:MAG: molybdopterin-dependent oxidoreductase [Verrucomicrobiaceae bacterium]|nr:molybdopterin-dependent oxidoreductase [Verrucomicrobiaceae bacterium]